jgi:collagenase-like PrtC family protease
MIKLEHSVGEWLALVEIIGDEAERFVYGKKHLFGMRRHRGVIRFVIEDHRVQGLMEFAAKRGVDVVIAVDI